MKYVLALLGALLCCPVAADDLYTYRAEIVSVYDGDTATVDIDLGFNIWMRDQTLRFYCVNTPEVRGVEREHGLIVRDAVRRWLPAGSEIILQSVEDRTGKYGRWLAVLTPIGWDESVNARLMREGMAEIEAYSQRQENECRVTLGLEP